MPTAKGRGKGGGEERARQITVRTHSGATHSLAVKISPYMPYFGSEELHKLDELASMVGLAIERCEMAEQMAFQASHDGLTGLANRSLFMDRLQESLRHVGRRRAALAVMFIDLDRFKLVNDRGRPFGRRRRPATRWPNRLTAMTRGVDVVARFGGDEFVAFAEVDHEADALDMAERIRRGLERAGGDRRRAPRRHGEHRRRGHRGRVPPRRPCCSATRTTPCTRPSARDAIRSCCTAATPATSPTSSGA